MRDAMLWQMVEKMYKGKSKKKRYLTSDSVSSTTLPLTWNEC